MRLPNGTFVHRPSGKQPWSLVNPDDLPAHRATGRQPIRERRLADTIGSRDQDHGTASPGHGSVADADTGWCFGVVVRLVTEQTATIEQLDQLVSPAGLVEKRSGRPWPEPCGFDCRGKSLDGLARPAAPHDLTRHQHRPSPIEADDRQAD